MKITYHVATSLDGFIAGEDGDVSWLDDVNIDMSETGLDDFFADIDVLVMGRSTYDFVFNYGSWPYEDIPAWVCTSSELGILEGANLKTAGTVDEFFSQAKSNGLNNVWLVGGGKLASSFIDNGLLTHISISEMPVALQTGIPLFANHKLEDLSIEKTEVFQRRGFKQKEIALRS